MTDANAESQSLDEISESVKLRLSKAQESYSRQANKHRQEVSIKEGDWVYLRIMKQRIKQVGKKCPKLSFHTTVPQVTEDSKILLKGMVYKELEDWVTSSGYKRSQALMLWRWMYGSGKWAQHVDNLDGFNKSFTDTLRDTAEFNALSCEETRVAADGTRKMIFSVGGSDRIETVLIPGPRNRVTVCVSSQVGCAMNCQFCYTGRMGLKRNLTTAQIVEQLVIAQRNCAVEMGLVTNVVFMGMGEPLHNIENVLRAAEIMTDLHGLHISPRKVTVSTSGLVPQLRRFCKESSCSLAVSLNATTDEVRNWIMPVNRKYNLAMLLGVLRDELSEKKDFKVFFEYVLLAGINDSMEDAHRLIELVKDIPCKINLITFNPHAGASFLPTPEQQTLQFRDIIANAGLVVAIRHSRGDDQMAACGQLGKVGFEQAPKLRVPPRFEAALTRC
ncbi:hypothetical protein GOP47_0003769 [Adiantum capillus-veneris]|uniref:Radical SAM core domain-containing protein n=1 Tax=Adiantum capillus-veneris TaxID=13818 RepID=A0A9D4V7A5_ADICA|nr:hypothetical protein GOP47_0003769 [Adiantum capillus-veneris]